MTTLNPYASFLEGAAPFPVLAATGPALAGVVARMAPAQLDRRPGAGKWSVREILCHLADTEMVFAFRLRQTLAEASHVVQPFDQEIWAERYAAYDAAAALSLFTAVRQWNLKLLAAVTDAEWDKGLTHPERGAMTFRTIVETMAGHDRNHLRQVEGIVGGLTG